MTTKYGKKILPFYESQEYRAYHHDAFFNGICAINSAFNNNWITLNFLNLRVKESFVFYDLPSRINKWDCFKEKKKYYFGKNVIGFVKKLIDLDYYVYIFVNERYITHRESYGVMDFDHNNLIIGYDNDSKQVLLVGYDVNRRYISHWVSFSEINCGYYYKHYKFPCKCIGLKYLYNNNIAILDTRIIIKKLRKAMYSTSVKYGLNCYDFIKICCEKNFNIKKNLDNRFFRVLYEHINAYKILDSKLFDSHYCSDLQDLQNELIKLHYLSIKYNITKHSIIEIKLKELLDKCKSKEKMVIVEMLNELLDKEKK